MLIQEVISSVFLDICQTRENMTDNNNKGYVLSNLETEKILDLIRNTPNSHFPSCEISNFLKIHVIIYGNMATKAASCRCGCLWK